MHRRDLEELASNPDLISGIYNYCDRWCERCPFTSRCLVFATEQADEDLDDPETRDINNARFWQKLGSVWQQAQEMIAEWAEKAGVDLTAVDSEEAIEEQRQRRAAANKNVLAIAAREYAAATNEWFAREIEAEVHDDLSKGDGPESLDVTAEDAMEVIRWYQFLIAAKVIRAGMRAASDFTSNDEDGLEAEELPFDYSDEMDEPALAADDSDDLQAILDKAARQDANGSAKVALIAIDRSMTAWRVLHTELPDKADSIMPLLAALERLRVGTEEAHPKARDFIRPGFDENISDFVS